MVRQSIVLINLINVYRALVAFHELLYLRVPTSRLTQCRNISASELPSTISARDLTETAVSKHIRQAAASIIENIAIVVGLN